MAISLNSKQNGKLHLVAEPGAAGKRTGVDGVATNIRVSTVVVSYNTREMTLDCLRAITSTGSDQRLEIFAVDNNSGDGSAAAIREAFPDVTLIVNERNLGFGAANNQAMRLATGEFVLLVNSDAFVKTGSVEAMLDCMHRNPRAGVVGPRLVNHDGSLQRSCFRFPSPGQAWRENLWLTKLFGSESKLGDYRRWGHDFEREVDWVVGACLLVRREAVETVGDFDEEFFMYGEETDWQRRMRDAGWRIFFTPTAEVTHLGGESGKAEQAKISQSFFNSLDRYELKHHGVWGLLALRAAMAVGCLLRLVIWAVVLICVPPRRAVAAAKVKLMGWLLWRQTTCWKLATA